MGDTFAVSALRRENLLVLARDIITNAQGNRYPLERFFLREQVDGDQIKIPVRKLPHTVGETTSSAGPGHLIREGTLEHIYVDPIYNRPIKEWDNKDIALFAEWDEVAQTKGAPMEALEARIAKKLAKGLAELMAEIRPTMHDMYVGALLGEYIYYLGEAEITVSYNHPTLDPPQTVWTNFADANIPVDLGLWKQQFLDQSDGQPMTHAFYNSRAWAEYFLQNENFQTYVLNNPELARQFGVEGSVPGIITDNEGTLKDPFANLEWVSISGPHVKNDVSVDRWPVEKIAFAALDTDDDVDLLVHAMIADLYNPDPEPNFETWQQDEPKLTSTRGSDQGAAIVSVPGRVQIADVTST
jgi:hypothetical protein